MFINECFADFLIGRIERISLSLSRGKKVLELDGMVEGVEWWKTVGIFLLENVCKFLVGVQDILYSLVSLLDDISGYGHLFDANSDENVLYLVKNESI